VADPADPSTFRAAVLDPGLAEAPPHSQLLAMYTELIALRRTVGVLTDRTAEQTVQRFGDAIVIDRVLPASPASASRLVLNFSPTPISIALGAATTVRFDSSDPTWGNDAAVLDRQNRSTVSPWSARLST
jgi:maltooligosyltrehalose trehalohydrolase